MRYLLGCYFAGGAVALMFGREVFLYGMGAFLTLSLVLRFLREKGL